MDNALWQDLKIKVDKTSDELVEARIEIKSQGTQLRQIKTDIGGLHTKMDKLTDHMLADVKKSNSFLKSTLLKVILIVLGSLGLGGGAIAGVSKLLNSADVGVVKVVDNRNIPS